MTDLKLKKIYSDFVGNDGKQLVFKDTNRWVSIIVGCL